MNIPSHRTENGHALCIKPYKAGTRSLLLAFSMSTQVIDQEARDDAMIAIGRIDAHEQVCAERQLHILAGIADLKADVKGLFLRFWVAAITLITILLSVCGSLVYLILSKSH